MLRCNLYKLPEPLNVLPSESSLMFRCGVKKSMVFLCVNLYGPYSFSCMVLNKFRKHVHAVPEGYLSCAPSKMGLTKDNPQLTRADSDP
uniref:Uncharacterized protein n=1 Tax=Rhizoctonia solani TaxID=456999 RepID=N0A701_9AGAM|nr:hypothetical protein RSOL_m01000 [Rhizoctonia solani]AGK45416.1 hypothetical protein RSOL_m01000 [Rhizoctonia solani]